MGKVKYVRKTGARVKGKAVATTGHGTKMKPGRRVVPSGVGARKKPVKAGNESSVVARNSRVRKTSAGSNVKSRTQRSTISTRSCHLTSLFSAVTNTNTLWTSFLCGAVYLPDGHVLLADDNSQSVKLYKPSGRSSARLLDELRMEYPPSDITMLDDVTAAITFRYEVPRAEPPVKDVYGIQLISVGQKSLAKLEYINTSFIPSHICGYNGRLAVTCENEPSLKLITRDGKVVHKYRRTRKTAVHETDLCLL
jgi:hypothetical protein